MAKYSAVATQMYVWLQVYSRQGKNVEEHLDEAFGEVKAAGFDALEGWLSWCATTEKAQGLHSLLRKHGLTLTSLYHGGNYHEREPAAQTVAETIEWARRARDIGCSVINVNPNPLRGQDKSDEQLEVQCEFLNGLALWLDANGMSLTLHHHDPEMRNDAHEFRYNLAHTDARLLGCCLDFHWIYRGGQDPLALLRECGRRVRSTHLRNSVGGVWSETFGDGDIDYREVKAVLDETNYAGPLIVELAYEQQTQLTRPLGANMKLGRGYVKSVFGV